jgi:Fe-S-cluster containining protein
MGAVARLLGLEAPPSREPVRQCRGCGQCCEQFGGHLHASKRDIARWTALGRDDLLRRVSGIGWLWIDPETGTLEKACPFLERTDPDTALCTIHEIKPDICRDYPTLAHGRRCLRGVFLCSAAALLPCSEAFSALAALA